jgi:hypothetical protein
MSVSPGIRARGLLLRPSTASDRDAEVAVVATTAAPSGGSPDGISGSLAAAQTAIALRDAAAVQDMVYATPDGGTTWKNVLRRIVEHIDHAATNSGSIGNGSTAGRLRTNATVNYRVAGTLYSKSSTDDLWNLSAETNTSGAQYRAYYLYLDASGTATIGAGSNAASAAAAIAALPDVAATKAVIGVYVAGLSTDFDGAGGLAAQGTVYNGYASAAV